MSKRKCSRCGGRECPGTACINSLKARGPWKYTKCEAGFAILAFVDDTHGPSVIANIPLHLEDVAVKMAAIPEMLEALKAAAKALDRKNQNTKAQVLQALAKAKGN